MAWTSLRVIQVSGGEQVEGERKKNDNSDNLMKINKNVAMLDKKSLARSIKTKNVRRPGQKFFVDFKNEVSNSRPQSMSSLDLPLWHPQLPYTVFALIINSISYARVNYRVCDI